MSQSVKLSDGSYIDASGVWDNNAGMTLEAIHLQLGSACRCGVKNFTVTKQGTMCYDTENAITLTPGRYLIGVHALVTSEPGQWHIELYNPAISGWLTYESYATIYPVAGDNWTHTASIVTPYVADVDIPIYFGAYCINASNKAIRYEIWYVKFI